MISARHQIVIRQATVVDVPAILAVHRAAVLDGAAGSYDIETRLAWAADQSPVWIARLTDALAGGDELMLVATEAERIIAFGSIVPAENQLRALYVDNGVQGRGIGGRLLEHLEALATEWGVTMLSLDASLNARAFYGKHGYREVAHGSHRLAGGATMSCIRMSRELA